MSENVYPQLHLYRGYTLVDITKTNVTRSDEKNIFQRNQQRNWETLVQVLSLRTQLTILGAPEIVEMDGSKFDAVYSGNQSVWTFKFGVEYDDIFSDGYTMFGTLEYDFINVPIIADLHETVKFAVPTFDAKVIKNIYFEEILL